jgi:hypothetical protein
MSATRAVTAAILAVAAMLRGLTQRGLYVPRSTSRDPWHRHHGKGHGRGKLRKGTRPKVYPWHLVQEIPRGQVGRRLEAGQGLCRRPDGVWIWPADDRREYERRERRAAEKAFGPPPDGYVLRGMDLGHEERPR